MSEANTLYGVEISLEKMADFSDEMIDQMIRRDKGNPGLTACVRLLAQEIIKLKEGK